MYSYSQVADAISKFIDTEIIPTISGWQRWVVGGGAGLFLSNSSNVFNEMKTNEIVKMLGIIDESDRINVDKIYRELKKQAHTTDINIDIPLVGSVRLGEQDLDRLYNIIRNE